MCRGSRTPAHRVAKTVTLKFSVVRVLSKGIFAVVGDRTGGPLLESGHYLPKGLEGGGLLLQEPA